jgi:hypothetical protein
MRKTVITLVYMMFVTLALAQVPERVNYQAIARDPAGIPLIDTPVDLTFEILEGSPTGTVVFTENQSKTTNQFGLFTAEIGAVNTVGFPTIMWGANTYFLRISVNGDVMPATQLLSVPYALHAKTAGSGVAGADGINCWDTNANGINDAAEDINGDTFFNGLDCKGDSGVAGASGTNGIGIQWLGAFADAPTSPNLNDAYYDTGLGKSLIWDSSAWITMAQDGSSATLIAGTGIDLSGNTVTNTSPDQTVAITGTGGATVTGTYPNFTVNSTDNVNDADSDVTNETITSVAFDSTNLNIDEAGTLHSVDLSALQGTTYSSGTGIDLAGDVVTNTSPDQTVILTGTGGTNVTGTYPNFTVNSTDNVNDADADVTNEVITNFGLNGTSDSLVIDEAGNLHAVALSDLAGSTAWTKGTGNDIYNNTDSVGIGTINPKSTLQLGDNMHLYPLSMGSNDYSVSTYNAYWDGTTLRNTIGGSSGFSFLGHEVGTPMFGIQLFPTQVAGGDITSGNPVLTMKLKNKGLGINVAEPLSALDLKSIDSSAILIGHPYDDTQATMNYTAGDGNVLGLRVPYNLPGGDYTLTYPSDLPGTAGSSLVSDLSGNLSWDAPSVILTALWSQPSAGIIHAGALTDRIGIGTIAPLSKFQIGDIFHMDAIDPGTGWVNSIITNNLTAVGGANFARTITGTAIASRMGGDGYELVVFPSGAAGSLTGQPDANFTLSSTGAAFNINAVNGKGLKIQSYTDEALILPLSVSGDEARIVFTAGDGIRKVGLRAASTMTADYNITLPTSAGNANEVLTTDGAGITSWSAPATVTAGWELSGNTGTTATDFIGTTDAQDLRFTTNGTVGMTMDDVGQNLGIGTIPSSTYKVSVGGSAADDRGIYNSMAYTGAFAQYAIYNYISNTGTGSKYGVKNYLNETGAAHLIGISNGVETSGAGDLYGSINNVIGTGTGFQYGIMNYLSSNGSGTKYAIKSELIQATGTNILYGEHTKIDHHGTGAAYGNYLDLSASTTSGNTYGIYSTGEKDNYFSGNVGIGTNVPSTKLHINGGHLRHEGNQPTGTVAGSSDMRGAVNVNFAATGTITVVFDGVFTTVPTVIITPVCTADPSVNSRYWVSNVSLTGFMVVWSNTTSTSSINYMVIE